MNLMQLSAPTISDSPINPWLKLLLQPGLDQNPLLEFKKYTAKDRLEHYADSA
jgi:hypothetical protein